MPNNQLLSLSQVKVYPNRVQRHAGPPCDGAMSLPVDIKDKRIANIKIPE